MGVHNNESTECPDCGKALTISNLNKHIKSVHKKLKKTCDICNEEVPYSSISVHKRKVHNIGKPIDEVTPRGPNLKLRKRYQQSQNMEEEFDKMASTPARMKRTWIWTMRISITWIWKMKMMRKRVQKLFELETRILHSLLLDLKLILIKSKCFVNSL